MPLKTLIEFGLSEKEAKIYLALLELENAGVSEISKKAGVNRSSAYVVIESLRKKGLISKSAGKKTDTYIAESPNNLITLTEEQIKKQNQIKNNLEEIIAELKPLHKDTRNRPKIFIYSGQEALNKGFSDIFDEQVLRGMKIMRVYQDLSDILNFMPADFIKNDVTHLKRSGAKMRIICPDNKQSNEVVRQYKKFGSNDDFIIIPEKIFNERTSIGFSSFAVYEDKVECFLPGSSLIVIEQREIANGFKKLFDLAWEESKRLSRKLKT